MFGQHTRASGSSQHQLIEQNGQVFCSLVTQSLQFSLILYSAESALPLGTLVSSAEPLTNHLPGIPTGHSHQAGKNEACWEMGGSQKQCQAPNK